MLSRGGRACHSSLCRHLHHSWKQQRLLLGEHVQQGLPTSNNNIRNYGIFENFKKQIKGEIERNEELRSSFAELKKKAGDLASRTRATTESLYKRVDAVREEAEAKARQVSAAVKGKVSEATEQVKESVGVGSLRGEAARERAPSAPPESSRGAEGAAESDGAQAGAHPTAGEAGAGGGARPQAEAGQGPADGGRQPGEGMFQRAGEAWGAAAAGLGAGLRTARQTRAVDALKQGYSFLKEELSSTSPRRRAQQPPAPATEARSDSTALVVARGKGKTGWEKRWEELKDKASGHPLFQRLRRAGQPVMEKSQEIAEELRDRWETSDSAVVHRIQDLNESLFGETATAAAMREIRRRDPAFSLPEFILEVQEDVRPVLLAYLEGDVAALSRSCRREVVERCQAERRALEAQGLRVDNKILHISDVEVRETKMLQSDPIIIVGFHTQQTTCTKDRLGNIVEGGKDNILTVYYAWAMQQAAPEDAEEGQYEPRWKLREMQQLGMQALI